MNLSPKSPYFLAGILCLIISGVSAAADSFLPSHSQPPPLIPLGPGTHQLTGNLGNVDSTAGWRLKGETVWHANGEAATGLMSGTYWLEFKPVTGKLPPTTTFGEVNSLNSSFSASYVNDSEFNSAQTGWVRVENPGVTAPEKEFWRNSDLWRIEGETQWRTANQRSENLPCGVVTVEFTPLAGHLTPDPEFVRILPGQGVCLEVSYASESSGAWAMLPISQSEANQAPFSYVGLVHSSRGVFTGTAVGQYTVLTTLDAVFDPVSGSFAKGVTWTPASHAGTRRPPPRKSAGFIMMADYNSLSLTTDESKRLVAIYFTRSAADGGWSGYHKSVGTEWLSDRQARIIGYSGESGPAAQRGKIHASVLQLLGTPSGSIFTLPGLNSTPGLGGAALFTRRSDGRDYPAAILIGRGADARFRIIDQAVGDLITTAEDKALLDNGGTSSDGATQGTGDYGSGTIAKGYVRAAIQGSTSGTWKLALNEGALISAQPNNSLAKVEAEPATLKIGLSSQLGFGIPPVRDVRVVSNRTSEIDFTYTQTFDNWKTITFPGGGARTGPLDDFDGDGTANLLEWAFGLNPRVSDSNQTTVDFQPGMPLVKPSEPGGMTVQYLRRKSAVAAGVTYDAGFSSSLGSWHSGMEPDVEDAGSEWERVTVKDAGPVTGGRRFARVAVTPTTP